MNAPQNAVASEKVIKALAVVIELTGAQTPSKAALKVMLADLAQYPEPQVLGALRRCARELKGRVTLADILARLEDGRPGAEEAWAMIPKDEAGTVVWTDEMREAYGVAAPMISDGDLVPARMSFLEKYRALVQAARDARKPVRWEVSLGHDKNGRELVLLDAVEKGRLTVKAVQGLLPYHRTDEALNARLLALAGQALPALSAPGEVGKKALADLRGRFAPKAAA